MSVSLRTSKVDWFPRGATAAFCLAFLALLYFSFAANEECILWQKDGTWWIIQGKTQLAYRPLFSQVGVEPFEGSFDSYHPVFREYLLAPALTWLLFDSYPPKAMNVFVYAAFLLLAAYSLARTVAIDRPTALLGAFLLPLLAFPAFVGEPSRFIYLFSLAPDIAQIVGLSLLIVAALWTLDGKGSPAKYALIAVPAICFMLTILSAAAYLPCMLPATAIYGGAAFLDARRLSDNIPRVLAVLLMIVVPVALGAAEYVYGIFQYTAFNFFADEFQQVRSDWVFASTYWTGMSGRAAILLGLLGAAWNAYSQSGRLRLFASVHLVVTPLFLAVAVAVVRYMPDYKGISPVYAETCFWPYTLIFAAVAVLTVARAIAHVIARWVPVLAWMASASAIIVLTEIIIVVATSNVAAAQRPPACGGFYPIKSTAITDVLQEEIAIKPGSPFNGLVATIDGFEGRSSVTWQQLHAYDRAIWVATGNDHRMSGLWYYSIPTLFQYGSFRSPAYYLVLTDFFARPTDLQERSGLVLTQIHEPMMRLLGVRYVITDADAGIGKTVAEVPMPEGSSLRLIELPDVNIGNYSPTETRRVPDFHSGLSALHAADFVGRRTVITDVELGGSFVPAKFRTLIYERDGFHLTADSAGVSLLVLPIQYSHCWSVEGEGAPRLFRANLLELGIRFHGNLDAKLVFRHGPIFAGACRIEDLRDMTRLKVSEARRDRR
jgi:hypothetical protein